MTTARAPGRPIDRAFAALDRAGVDWVVLRGIGQLAGPHDDVDVLVDAAGLSRLDPELAADGFVRVPAHGHGSHRFPLGVREHEFRAYDVASDAWVDLDVLSEVAFGADLEFRTALGRALLDRRRRVDGVNRLHPHDELWYLLVHDLLKRGEPAGHRRERLQHLAGTVDGSSPVAVEMERVFPGSAAALRQAVAQGDWDRVRSLGRAVRRQWLLRRGLGVGVVLLASRLTRHVPALRATGLSVAILGPDGAGKTTLANSLRATIPMPSRYVYLGIWRDSRFEAQLRRVLGARLTVRLLGLLVKSGWISLQRRLGHLVLLDRFTVDADLPGDGMDWKGRVSASLVRRTVGQPDLVIVLDAPAELMFERKGEHGVEVLGAFRDAYLRVVDDYAGVVIDATQPADEVRREATEKIWGRWARRVQQRAASRQKAVEPSQGVLPEGEVPVEREGLGQV